MTRLLDVSVVLYHPDPSVLADFADSLAASARRLADCCAVTTRLWLVDNGEADRPPDWDDADITRRVGDAVAECRTIRGHGNVGYGAGHNLALAAAGQCRAHADFHLIANSDLLMDSDALEAAVRFLDTNPDIGLLSPKVTNHAGQQEFLCKREPAVLDLLLRGFAPGWLKRRFRRRLDHYEMRDVTLDAVCRGVPLASGAFMFFRADILRAVGGFDDSFFLYFEDFDLSKRAAVLAGVAYVPSVRVVHFGGHAARKGWRHRRMFAESLVRYFAKHGWRLA